MVLGHLLKRYAGELSYFIASARQPGLAAELMSLLDELGRNGLLWRSDGGGGEGETPLDKAIAAVETMEGEGAGNAQSGALLRKLRDVRVLYGRYTEFMGPGRFDKDSRMDRVLRHVGTCQALRGGADGGASFFIDGFLELQDFERRMIVSLAELSEKGLVGDVEVSFCMPANSPLLEGRGIHGNVDPMSVFRRVEEAHRQLRIELESRQVRAEVVRLDAARGGRFKSPQLSAIEARLGGHRDVQPTPDEGRVVLMEGPDVRSEADAVAREIRRLTRAEGGAYRLREILVLVREMESQAGSYERAITASLREHGIRVFLDRKRDASCHPLIRVIRAGLQIAGGGWTTASVVAIAKSGFGETSEEEAASGTSNPGDHEWGPACRLENWAVSRGVRGEGWTARHDSSDPDVESLRSRVVNAVKRVVDGVSGGEGISVRDACSRLLAMLGALGVRPTLARWIREAEERGEYDVAREHEQVWANVMTFLEEMSDLLGQERVTAEELQTIVLSGLEGLELGFTPPTVDQVVVGTAERTRPGEARVVFVMGMSGGVFPVSIGGGGDAGVISDLERQRLSRLRVPLDPDGRQRQLDERLVAYLALTRAAERIYLSRPTADERGAPLPSSEYWEAVRALWSQIEVRQLQGETEVGRAMGNSAGLDQLSTPRLLALGLLRWARDETRPRDPAWQAVYGRFARWPVDNSAVDLCRHAVWSSLVPAAERCEEKLSEETTRRLFPVGNRHVRLRESQIESFAACPHQHFLRHVLRLTTVYEPEVRTLEVSGVLHDVLTSVTQEWEAESEGAGWPDLSATETERRLHRIAEAAIDQKVREMTWDGSPDRARLTPRDRYLLSRVSVVLGQVLRAHAVAAARTAYRPRRAHVRFGGETEGPGMLPGVKVTLTLGGGEVGSAVIGGTIDRVDATSDGRRLAAWDYAWGKRDVDLVSLYHGLDVKLLLHLLVLRDHGDRVVEGSAGSGGVSGAFAVGIGPKVESFSDVQKWLDAPEVGSADYQLRRRKAAGLFNADHLKDLDTALVNGDSPIFRVNIKLNGELGSRYKDALTPAELDALLEHARQMLGKLASGIVEGVVAIRPYKLGKATPCPDCEFRAVCRFDPRDGGRYLELEKLNVKEKLAGTQDSDTGPSDTVTEKTPSKSKRGGRRG
jgi:ATP-dependent helicase/nuclease subunit B